MRYLIEQFKWEGKEYYHIVNSKIFDSDKQLKERGWYVGDSYFHLIQLENEVQTSRRRSKKSDRKNV